MSEEEPGCTRELALSPGPGSLPWLAALPDTVRDLADRWSLRVAEPYRPGGMTAWVAPAEDAEGRACVLKVGWRHDEAEHEADGLRILAGRGAVRLYAAEQRGETSALLLERCSPGAALRQLPEPEQDVVLAGLLPRLWLTPPAGHPIRTLQSMCEPWADAAQSWYAQSSGLLDPGLVRLGLQLFRTLSTPAEHDVLLATDLHAGNVLSAEREPWLMIDPKPYLGDRAYDVLQFLINCRERLSADPVGLANRMADLCGLDPSRVRRWLFARCVQMAPTWPWLAPVAIELTRCLDD